MKVVVCIGSSCHLKGSRNIVSEFQNLIAKYELGDLVSLGGTFCMGRCQEGVCVTVDGEFYSVTPESAREFFETVILTGARK
ncbi:Thioredoxin-like [2Fe-2S] ferredoxin [Ruminococcus sp. YE71]|uniref:(2Fe-2S) ferredoxin domain-containing protein n=1 Tax=unclassified Ruminococcus TaxID=2608920 RepID=UPI00088E5D8C|nr:MULTISPECIES: (2Fe-2S) ferredoxin domain-containing protein [unclassified Ruminococcus]SDA22758.1 Thioredoxin-like [2Fe-2S] ferredoxin [Ruminococcus sp. YE78]SFW38742.1 Thioredoxin-like [2Fe-2S] ferredoxin [Ruminococcus sp. YE71]